ncbi:MAG TPA: LuxR C-terminal-related transcriptional regulator [Anaerolineaceae bacterium]
MSFLQEFLRQLGLVRDHEPLRFELEEPFRDVLFSLARDERRAPREVATDLLRSALAERHEARLSLAVWQSLSPREQEVTAFICLGYTNREIAARLGIAYETVRTHVRNLLAKFNLRTKADLRQVLSGWDFSAWK